MRVEEVRANEITVAVDVFGSKLLVAYRPFALDGQQSLEVSVPDAGTLDNSEVLDRFYRSVCSQLTLWDLTDGDEPIPIDAESVRRVPIDLLLLIVQAVANDKAIRRQRSLQETANATWVSTGPGESGAQDEAGAAPELHIVRSGEAQGAEDDHSMSLAEFQSTELAAANEASWDLRNKHDEGGGRAFSNADNAGDHGAEG